MVKVTIAFDEKEYEGKVQEITDFGSVEIDLHEVDTDVLLAELQSRKLHTDTEHLMMLLNILNQKPMYSDPKFVDWYRTLEDVWINIRNQRNKNAEHLNYNNMSSPNSLSHHETKKPDKRFTMRVCGFDRYIFDNAINKPADLDEIIALLNHI